MIHKIKLEPIVKRNRPNTYTAGCDEFTFYVRGQQFRVAVEYDYLHFMNPVSGLKEHGSGIERLCKALRVPYNHGEPLLKYFQEHEVFGPNMRPSRGAFPVFRPERKHEAITNMLRHFESLR